MEEFITSVFEKSKEKGRKRLIYNFVIFGSVGGIWVLYFVGFPFVGLKIAIPFSIVVLGIKLNDDRSMGISAYGDRKANLIITEKYLQIAEEKIPYTDVTNLIIYVDEYLGMPKEIYGIHHGGNNKIEFESNGKLVSINYVIKDKQDFKRVSLLVNKIENDSSLKMTLRKL